MIYIKTQLGQTVFQNRSVFLTPRQRSTFILFDGKRPLSEVMNATAGLGISPDDVQHLVCLGLLALAPAALQIAGGPAAGPASSPAAAPEPPPAGPSVHPQGLPTLAAQAHCSKAYPIATRLTAGLGLRGFRLNLAVQAAGDLDKLKELAPASRRPSGQANLPSIENALYD